MPKDVLGSLDISCWMQIVWLCFIVGSQWQLYLYALILHVMYLQYRAHTYLPYPKILKSSILVPAPYEYHVHWQYIVDMEIKLAPSSRLAKNGARVKPLIVNNNLFLDNNKSPAVNSQLPARP
jgi:hypothetical protein